MMSRWRSLLFVAADDKVRLEKITERGADAVILDLEDAVPADRKAHAREALPAAVDALARGGHSVVIRINAPWQAAIHDLPVAVRNGVAAIMVPKVEGVVRLAAIAEMVTELSVIAGLACVPGLIALIESPAGLGEMESIAAVPEVIALALGSEDFSLALGVPPTRDALDLPCRMLALAAARRGLMALGLPISIATIDDLPAWKNAIHEARACGLTGALCVHPRQVQPVNDGFGCSAKQVEAARRLLSAWAEAGSCGVIRFEGRMIDRPVALAAQRMLATAGTTVAPESQGISSRLA